VRLFASLREAAGRGEAELSLEPDATAEHAWQALVREHPALAARRASLAASVNRRYAPFDTALADGDEVVFIPPVSGG
jgi:sulfur-carrier protein